MTHSVASKRSFLSMPSGFGSLYPTELFSSVSVAVLLAALMLYMNEQQLILRLVK